jgi:hypothetical protein
MSEKQTTRPAMASALIRARIRAVPLVAVRTADQPAAVRVLTAALLESAVERDEPPPGIVVHDPVRGFAPGTTAGAAGQAAQEAIAAMLGDLDPSMSADPVTALTMAAAAPPDTVVIMMAGDRALGEPRPALAALLLRDRYAAGRSTLVVLGASWSPAAELGSDVYVLDDEPPETPERRSTVERLVADAKLRADTATIESACGFTRGLSRFAVEQTVSLALNGKGLRLDVLARVWREAIDRTPGLRVESTGSGDAESVAGLAALQAHAARVTSGRARPDVVVWIDEIEKALAGSSGAVADSSGASQAVLGSILTAMEQSGAEGMILVGPPGTGKSLSARVMGAAAGVPVIQLDPGRIKGSLVGQTEAQAAAAMAALRAMGGRCYWVATSNGLATVPPELLRRFTDGVWFVDLPAPDERAALWRLYLDRWDLQDEMPASSADVGYSGADVRNVCRTAWRDGVSVAAVMASYVPASNAARDRIEALRRGAVGAYRSASYTGAYRMPVAEPASQPATGRKLQLGREG